MHGSRPAAAGADSCSRVRVARYGPAISGGSAASKIDSAWPSLSAPPLSSPSTRKICSAVRCWISCATISAGRPPSRLPRPSAVRPARPTGRRRQLGGAGHGTARQVAGGSLMLPLSATVRGGRDPPHPQRRNPCTRPVGPDGIRRHQEPAGDLARPRGSRSLAAAARSGGATASPAGPAPGSRSRPAGRRGREHRRARRPGRPAPARRLGGHGGGQGRVAGGRVGGAAAELGQDQRPGRVVARPGSGPGSAGRRSGRAGPAGRPRRWPPRPSPPGA